METENIDAMNFEEKRAYVAFLSEISKIESDDPRWTDVGDWLGRASGGSPKFGLLLSLQEYVRISYYAERERKRGFIERAQVFEARMDSLYERIPENLRW